MKKIIIILIIALAASSTQVLAGSFGNSKTSGTQKVSISKSLKHQKPSYKPARKVAPKPAAKKPNGFIGNAKNYLARGFGWQLGKEIARSTWHATENGYEAIKKRINE